LEAKPFAGSATRSEKGLGYSCSVMKRIPRYDVVTAPPHEDPDPAVQP
jgi:hypothetical protein